MKPNNVPGISQLAMFDYRRVNLFLGYYPPVVLCHLHLIGDPSLHLRHLEGSPKMAHQKHRRSWLSAWAYLRQKNTRKIEV